MITENYSTKPIIATQVSNLGTWLTFSICEIYIEDTTKKEWIKNVLTFSQSFSNTKEIEEFKKTKRFKAVYNAILKTK